MKKMIYIFFAVLALACFITGCSNNDSEVKNHLEEIEESNFVTPSGIVTQNKPVKISAEEAKKIIDSDIDYIILDVRSKEEYDEGHIDGAVLLPVDNIKDEAGPVIGGKNKTILVYCRSGNRSSLAASRLASLGYTDIRDFGGIVDWPYEIVK